MAYLLVQSKAHFHVGSNGIFVSGIRMHTAVLCQQLVCLDVCTRPSQGQSQPDHSLGVSRLHR